MYSFQFKHIVPLQKDGCLTKGCYLWIWNATKIPPHIGISNTNSYFSLKVKGKDMGLTTGVVFDLIQKKGIPTLIIEIKRSPDIDLENVFNTYVRAESGRTSCLSPILDFFNLHGEVKFLFELLTHFEKNGVLGTVFGLNLPLDYKGIPQYGKAEIENRLKLLENAKGEKCLS
jgi:hypothetical protein